MPDRLRSALDWVRANVELGGLLILALVVSGVWAFAILAEEVLEGDTQNLDRHLLLLLRTPGDPAQPIGPTWVQEIMRDLTALGGTAILTLATFAVAGFFLLRGKRALALYLLVAVGGGLLLSTLAKEFFARPRPDLVPARLLRPHGELPLGPFDAVGRDLPHPRGARGPHPPAAPAQGLRPQPRHPRHGPCRHQPRLSGRPLAQRRARGLARGRRLGLPLHPRRALARPPGRGGTRSPRRPALIAPPSPSGNDASPTTLSPERVKGEAAWPNCATASSWAADRRD